jgi:dienelactone hydrolase
VRAVAGLLPMTLSPDPVSMLHLSRSALLIASLPVLGACAPLSTQVLPPTARAPDAAPYAPSTLRRPSPGPHAIGFRAVELVDPSRGFGAPYDHEGNPAVVLTERPIAVSTWYPAAPGGSPMRFRDYLGFVTEPGEFPGPAERRLETVNRIIRADVEPALPAHVRLELEAAVLARLDAPSEAGRFPLVIYSPGSAGSAIDNFYLHEWLASHGYVVVAVDSWGAFGRNTGDAEGLETQTRDMEYALGWARTLPNVDASRVAFAGFSWGGMANVMAAVRNPSVRAVVSLDGSIHFFAEQMRSFPFFAADRLTVPSLFLSAGHLAPDARARDGYRFFDELRYSDATMVVFPELRHLNFTIWSLVNEEGPGTNADTLVVSASLEWIARYTTAFLDAVLKDDPEGRAFLARSPEENGIPAAAALIERRIAHRPLPTLGAFAAEVRRRGRTLADALEVLDSVRESHPDWSLDENAVNTWGYTLLREGRHAEAIGVFELNTRLHPGAANPHDSLGDGYVAAGRLEEALASYRRAVQLAEASEDRGLASFRQNVQRTELLLQGRR